MIYIQTKTIFSNSIFHVQKVDKTTSNTKLNTLRSYETIGGKDLKNFKSTHIVNIGLVKSC